jgi:CubicO group peptidase (beta-lactamase class C family)
MLSRREVLSGISAAGALGVGTLYAQSASQAPGSPNERADQGGAGNSIRMVNGRFPASTPEEQGLYSSSIINFLDAAIAEDLGLHSIQIIRNGKLVASAAAKPYTLDGLHRMMSAAKSIVAAAVFFALSEGHFKLDDLAIDFFPNNLPANLDEKFKRMTIYHLLTINTGHDADTWGSMRDSENWVKKFFSLPPKYEPGTFYLYNNGVPHILACIVASSTKQDVREYLKSRLLEPLGIEMLMQSTQYGEAEPSTTVISPESLLKLAVFFLQDGAWDGKQLLDPAIIRMAKEYHATTRRALSENRDWDSGYCMQMWRNSFGGCRMDGGQGQFGVILNDVHMAVGFTASSSRTNRILELFEEHIYARMYKRPIAPHPDDTAEMRRRLVEFNLAPSGVSARSSIIPEAGGKTFAFADNIAGLKSISFDFADKVVNINTAGRKGRLSGACGLKGAWIENPAYLLVDADTSHLNLIYGFDAGKCLLSGGWSDDDTFVFAIRSHAAMNDFRVKCAFREGRLELTLPVNSLIVGESRNEWAPDNRNREPLVLRSV